MLQYGNLKMLIVFVKKNLQGFETIMNSLAFD